MRFLSYIWTSGRAKGQILLAFLLVAAFLWLIFKSLSQSMGFGAMWQSWMEAFIAFGTILIAVFIWINEQKQDWESNLPKRLNADFVYSTTHIYEIRNAQLAGSDDVRQWGQQIGMQMNQNRPLKFRGFKVQAAKRDFDLNRKHRIMLHTLTIWLHEIDADMKRKRWIYDDDGKVLLEEELQDNCFPPPSNPTTEVHSASDDVSNLIETSLDADREITKTN
jgi:hypothetical protein